MLTIILSTLLTLIGGRPVTQCRIKKSGDFGNKLSLLGSLLCFIHFGFIIYSDYVTREAALLHNNAFKEDNYIMQAIVDFVRIIAFIQEPILAVTSYRQSSAFLAFLNHMSDFDEYLVKNDVNLKKILKRTKSVDRITGGIMCLVTILNILITVFMFKSKFDMTPTIYDLYIRLMPQTNYMLHILVAWIYFYVISLRISSFIDILEIHFKECYFVQIQNGLIVAGHKPMLKK